MLVLSRKLSQQIVIGSDISITVVKIDGNQVRLGIEAPRGVSILRDELVGRQNTREATAADRAGRPGVPAW
jgi:carbon storage regulator